MAEEIKPGSAVPELGQTEIEALDATKETTLNHWNRTRHLMILVVCIWFIVSVILPLFAPVLNKMSLFGFPMGYWLTAQGTLACFVIVAFWFAFRQAAFDKEGGSSGERP